MFTNYTLISSPQRPDTYITCKRMNQIREPNAWLYKHVIYSFFDPTILVPYSMHYHYTMIVICVILLDGWEQCCRGAFII